MNQVVTIAVTEAMNVTPEGDLWVDPTYAPIWTDGTNNYLVASGLLGDDYQTTYPVKAVPDRVNIIVDMPGLDALAAMELVLVEEPEDA